MTAKPRQTAKPPAHRSLPGDARIYEAYDRLARERALHTLVHGTLSPQTLRRALRHEVPRKETAGMTDELWANVAAHAAFDSEAFCFDLAQLLHDRLGWDREPSDEEWERLAAERPLEALWNAALSESKAMRKGFGPLAGRCVAAHRASPSCPPPSWEYVESLLDFDAAIHRDLAAVERERDDAVRRYEVDHERLEDLREELKRLRRENAELRATRAQAERRAETLAARPAPAATDEARRIEELERRLRRAEKERDHLASENERLLSIPPGEPGAVPRPVPAPPPLPTPTPEPPPAPPEGPAPALDPSLDPNPRRRLLRQILKKLFTKGKIGGAHTHEDNVYRGVADHEKGLAKEVIGLLAREGYLVLKPTIADPHVSLAADRTGEIQSIVEGRLSNPRLLRFVGEAGERWP